MAMVDDAITKTWTVETYCDGQWQRSYGDCTEEQAKRIAATYQAHTGDLARAVPDIQGRKVGVTSAEEVNNGNG